MKPGFDIGDLVELQNEYAPMGIILSLRESKSSRRTEYAEVVIVENGSCRPSVIGQKRIWVFDSIRKLET